MYFPCRFSVAGAKAAYPSVACCFLFPHRQECFAANTGLITLLDAICLKQLPQRYYYIYRLHVSNKLIKLMV